VCKNPDDGQRNCQKHVEFYSKNKFEKLVHLVGFIIRIFHDARSPERQSRDHTLFSQIEQINLFIYVGNMISYEGELDIYNKLNNFLKITGILNNVFRPQKTLRKEE